MFTKIESVMDGRNAMTVTQMKLTVNTFVLCAYNESNYPCAEENFIDAIFLKNFLH